MPLCLFVIVGVTLCLSVCSYLYPHLSLCLSLADTLTTTKTRTLTHAHTPFSRVSLNLPTAERVSDSTICTVCKRLTGILTRYVTTQGGRDGVEQGRRANDEHRQGEKEREHRGTYWLKAGLHAQCVRDGGNESRQDGALAQMKTVPGYEFAGSYICACVIVCESVCACVYMWALRYVPLYVRAGRVNEFEGNTLQVIIHLWVPKQWIWVLLHKNVMSDCMTLGGEDLNRQFGVFICLWGLYARVVGRLSLRNFIWWGRKRKFPTELGLVQCGCGLYGCSSVYKNVSVYKTKRISVFWFNEDDL